MSIIVNLYYTGSNGNARKFVQEMEESGIADAIRKEEGNERYEYFFPMKDKETVLLIDRWVDQASIDAHHATTTMEKITQLREKYDLHMKMERFITDGLEIPSNDEKFIRK